MLDFLSSVGKVFIPQEVQVIIIVLLLSPYGEKMFNYLNIKD